MIWAKGGPQQGALDPNAQIFGSQAIPASLLPSPPFDPSSGSLRGFLSFPVSLPGLRSGFCCIQSEGKRHLHRLLTQGSGKRLLLLFREVHTCTGHSCLQSSSSHVDSSSPSATLSCRVFCSFCTFLAAPSPQPLGPALTVEALGSLPWPY